MSGADSINRRWIAGASEQLASVKPILFVGEWSDPHPVHIVSRVNRHRPGKLAAQIRDQLFGTMLLAESTDLQEQRARRSRGGTAGGSNHSLCLIGGLCAECFNSYTASAALVYIKFHGRSPRQINDAVRVKRTAIIASHNSTFAVIQIGDPCPGRKRQGFVSSAQLIHVVGLAARGAVAVKFGSIPGSNR